MTRRLVRRPTVRTRIWWAAVSAPSALPVLFASKPKAAVGKFREESLVRVRVEALHPAERVLKLPRETARRTR